MSGTHAQVFMSKDKPSIIQDFLKSSVHLSQSILCNWFLKEDYLLRVIYAHSELGALRIDFQKVF